MHETMHNEKLDPPSGELAGAATVAHLQKASAKGMWYVDGDIVRKRRFTIPVPGRDPKIQGLTGFGFTRWYRVEDRSEPSRYDICSKVYMAFISFRLHNRRYNI